MGFPFFSRRRSVTRTRKGPNDATLSSTAGADGREVGADVRGAVCGGGVSVGSRTPVRPCASCGLSGRATEAHLRVNLAPGCRNPVFRIATAAWPTLHCPLARRIVNGAPNGAGAWPEDRKSRSAGVERRRQVY